MLSFLFPVFDQLECLFATPRNLEIFHVVASSVTEMFVERLEHLFHLIPVKVDELVQEFAKFFFVHGGSLPKVFSLSSGGQLVGPCELLVNVNAIGQKFPNGLFVVNSPKESDGAIAGCRVIKFHFPRRDLPNLVGDFDEFHRL
jgi:hypothetical protein